MKKILFFLLLLCTCLTSMADNKPVIYSYDGDICLDRPYSTLLVDYEYDATQGDPWYIYQYSSNGTTWTRIYRSQRTSSYSQYSTNFKEGWYRVVVGKEAYDNNDPSLGIVSDPIYLHIVNSCPPRQTDADEESPYVCPQGTLLYHEDFGGNYPSAPVLSSSPAPGGIPYTQLKGNIKNIQFGAGKYTVTKYGWINSASRFSNTGNLDSQWVIQDDHTYPGDFSRGYFLQIDGKGGNTAFFTTNIDVCPDLDLSFSAYVANIMTIDQTKKLNAALPKVRFVIRDENGNSIHEVSSGDIPPTVELSKDVNGNIVRLDVHLSQSRWYLVGTSFHVPSGVHSLQLTIYNDVSDAQGNDFALDDIEIRLCTPLVHITSANKACKDSAYRFEAQISDDSSFAPPFDYRWEFSPDSLDWSEIADSLNLAFPAAQTEQTGWYRLMVAKQGNIDSPNCRAMSPPFRLDVTPCATEDPNVFQIHNLRLLPDPPICSVEETEDIQFVQADRNGQSQSEKRSARGFTNMTGT